MLMIAALIMSTCSQATLSQLILSGSENLSSSF